MIARDDMGFERLMEARARDDGAWQHDDYKLQMRYTDLNIESGDVAIIAEQEEINMDVSRKIYDRIGSAPMAPVVSPPERHPERMDRDERRDKRDAGKLRNAARLAFRNFYGQMEDANEEI